MNSFRGGGSLRKYLAGTAVDEITKIGGWETESVAKYYSGATSSKNAHGTRGNAARTTLALASYQCRLSFKTIPHRVREMIYQKSR